TSTRRATASPPSARTSAAVSSAPSRLRSATTTRAPASDARWQIARPAPRAPPVTTTTRPSRSRVVMMVPSALDVVRGDDGRVVFAPEPGGGGDAEAVEGGFCDREREGGGARDERQIFDEDVH